MLLHLILMHPWCLELGPLYLPGPRPGPHLGTDHITSHHITSYRIASHHITSHHITSHHIASHHTTPHHTTPHHITSHHITSHHITSYHTTSHHITACSRSETSKIARNGSGIDENQHNLVKTAQNCDASPAVTTGMRQDPQNGPKQAVPGLKRQVLCMSLGAWPTCFNSYPR